MNVAVVTWFDQTYDYNRYLHSINQQYCDYYGYNFIHSSDKTTTHLKPHWEKINIIKHALDKHDYVIWIDGDAHLQQDVDILNLIDLHFDINISYDNCLVDTKPQVSHQVNTGVIGVKNTQWSREILNVWNQLGPEASAAYSESQNFNFVWNDQGAFRWMMLKNIKQILEHIYIHKYGKLQCFSNIIVPGSCVMHYAGDIGKQNLLKQINKRV